MPLLLCQTCGSRKGSSLQAAQPCCSLCRAATDCVCPYAQHVAANNAATATSPVQVKADKQQRMQHVRPPHKLTCFSSTRFMCSSLFEWGSIYQKPRRGAMTACSILACLMQCYILAFLKQCSHCFPRTAWQQQVQSVLPA